MSKVMKTTSMADLLARIAGEYGSKRSVFDVPEANLRRALEAERSSSGIAIFSRRVGLPVGLAAGPHTQIAPNLVAGWIAGCRVFELKTVQKNDSLEIEKPCIDAVDEGHNVEWSTELSLAEARAEYLRGYLALGLLEAIFGANAGGERHGFVFNMSVGYDLEGIKTPKMADFIEGMRTPAIRASGDWEAAIAQMRAFVASPKFDRAFGGVEGAKARANAYASSSPDVSSKDVSPVHSVTLSTMHGCPPAEIERIGMYLLRELSFDVYVKLNPTLLGYDEVRAILDGAGWNRIELRRPTFEHDLQFADAVAMIGRLAAAAKGAGRAFGIKLSNTLANVNDKARMPGEERYMSGRALFPVTARLAAKLSEALAGDSTCRELEYSFCGGVSAANATRAIEAGLCPLTVATDALKPGGYQRMTSIAEKAAEALPRKARRPDPAALAAMASWAAKDRAFVLESASGRALARGHRIERKLPAFDCFAAPCVLACPVNQDVPRYVALAGAGATDEAFRAILADNALPTVTGTLCDHQCMEVCSRRDYEGPVLIRDVKLACARAKTAAEKPAKIDDAAASLRLAAIGAGPAGLSFAYRMAERGAKVVVFDASENAGGVPADVIPPFRIPREDIARDIDRLRALGVEFRFGTRVEDPRALLAEGFKAVFVGAGAPVAKPFPLAGSGVKVMDALDFLVESRNPDAFPGVRHVVVMGGGNTAMDACRAATRLSGKPSVSLSYRRTFAEMPADREELENALAEGATALPLTLPETAQAGGLVLREMELGPPDASGRRAPIATARTREIPCDLLVAAVGEEPDAKWFASFGATVGKDGRPVIDPATKATSVAGVYAGGDAIRGPSSIIAAEADGRAAAMAILRASGVAVPEASASFSRSGLDPAAIETKRARRGERKNPAEPGCAGLAEREADRCLQCDSVCLRCVEVCPNRANTFVATPGLADAMQVLHVDALCNECGNCGFFCPYDGRPYEDKPTLFDGETDLRASKNPGFAIGSGSAPSLVLRVERDGAIETADYGTWKDAKAGNDARSRTLALARAVFDGHRYLLGGKEARS